MEIGVYRIRFDSGDWHAEQGIESFYPYAEIVFRVSDSAQHYHVPLLLNPFGYSTYRGS
jgi:5-hydroxyisourate hydrolase